MDKELDQDTLDEDTSDDETSEDDISDDEIQSDKEGGEAAAQTFKIGDKEYTADQIKEFEKKALGYDALLPDYTRKSQELAKKGQEKTSEEESELKPPWEDPDYNPKNLGQYAKDILEYWQKHQEITQQKMSEAQAKIKNEVDDWVGQISKTDKEFDEEDFFDYASRMKFEINTIGGLKAVYSAYKELRDAGALGEEKGRKGKMTRQERVSAGKGGEAKGPDFTELRAKGGSIYDTAVEAFRKLKG